uniref:Putative secreted peptide n=1 Tax=Anopheles braziliensis TaxID=58242 RepID=A0A2M3ZRH9_9DIPT
MNGASCWMLWHIYPFLIFIAVFSAFLQLSVVAEVHETPSSATVLSANFRASVRWEAMIRYHRAVMGGIAANTVAE